MRASDLAADVLGVHLVHHVTERAEIILSVLAVDAIVDGDEANVVFREIVVSVLADLKVVPAETGGILDDDRRDVAHVHVLQHLLKAGTVEIGSRVAVIHVELGVGESMLLGVFRQELFLRRDLSRVFSAKVAKTLNIFC